MAIDDTTAGQTGSATDLDEIRTVKRAREGDVDAFEWIYRRYAGRIHGLCLRMTGDRFRAEELTQEAFVRAWEKLSLFEPRWSFSSWLYKLAVNVVLGDRRRERRRARWTAPAEAAREPGDTPSREASADGLDIERAMDRLPPRARMVFVLHDVEGHAHDDIARMAGIAVGTSKAQLHRARRLLREALTT